MIFSLYVNNNKKWSKLIILWIFITMAKFVTFSTPKFAVIKWDNTLLLPRQHKKKKKKKKNYGWSIEIILQVFNKLHMEVVASSKHTKHNSSSKQHSIQNHEPLVFESVNKVCEHQCHKHQNTSYSLIYCSACKHDI
jgi:hypothetical protein